MAQSKRPTPRDMWSRRVTLQEVWDHQIVYNDVVKELQQRSSAEWMQTYILGCISELGELLREMNWKKHRLENVEEFGPNVQEELADITKYVFSMWQLLNTSPQEMLNAVHQKGIILSQLLLQEQQDAFVDQKILMLDLDGVIADFRSGFTKWMQSSEWAEILSMGEHEFGLHMDLNHHWNYATYERAKREFEKNGGYGQLPTVAHVLSAVRLLKKEGYKILACTARPHHMYKRIWSDTWLWLLQSDLEVDGLYFLSEDRVSIASHLAKNNNVAALEDNPDLIKRYIRSDIPTVVVPQPYNKDIGEDPFLLKIEEDYEDVDIANLIDLAVNITSIMRDARKYTKEILS